MATSPRPSRRGRGPAKPKRKDDKVQSRAVSQVEDRFLEVSLGLLDAMPDEEYREASDKLHRLVTHSRASS